MLSRADREQEFCHQRLYYGSGNETKQEFPCNVSGKGGVDTAEMPAHRLRKDILETKQGGEIIVRHFGEDLLLNEGNGIQCIACVPDIVETNLAGNPTVFLRLPADTVCEAFGQEIAENDIEFRCIKQFKP